MTLQIKREKVNDDVRIYFSKVKLTEKKVEVGLPGEGVSLPDGGSLQAKVKDMSSGEFVDLPISEITNSYLQTIVDIPGVQVAVVNPYQIQITKAKQFDWDEIEKPLLQFLFAIHTDLTELDKNL